MHRDLSAHHGPSVRTLSSRSRQGGGGFSKHEYALEHSSESFASQILMCRKCRTMNPWLSASGESALRETSRVPGVQLRPNQHDDS